MVILSFGMSAVTTCIGFSDSYVTFVDIFFALSVASVFNNRGK